MQFHAYRLPGGPLVLDLQSDLMDTGTRLVAPLVPVGEGPSPLTRLEPILEIDGTAQVLHTAEMAAVPSHLLKAPPVADLRDRDYEIRVALDMVFSGF
ncbi:CcdB family protein [Marinibacterium profundimaris]|uniref:Toxin CcdB n=1 Tax=Marinibacterium profundimaris TaxID=1679460 RepID=A0A225NAM1_9RHOB|nr:CcdB family protein [Marinibacterium profundimaris]OWU66991.1 plasmid maintenance protein CcdB [Marinibacterium profundimaris]